MTTTKPAKAAIQFRDPMQAEAMIDKRLERMLEASRLGLLSTPEAVGWAAQTLTELAACLSDDVDRAAKLMAKPKNYDLGDEIYEFMQETSWRRGG